MEHDASLSALDSPAMIFTALSASMRNGIACFASRSLAYVRSRDRYRVPARRCVKVNPQALEKHRERCLRA